MLKLIVITILSVNLSGCLSWFGYGDRYDSRSLRVNSVDLFDQTRKSNLSKSNWLGDWVFRRERLALVDYYLRLSKPDVFIMQNALRRSGSPSESDTSILKAGALRGYDISSVRLNTLRQTGEDVHHSVAVSLPIKFANTEDTSKSWDLGDGGIMSLSLLMIENQIVSIFSVKMPPSEVITYSHFDAMVTSMEEHFQSGAYCPKRFIVTGYLPRTWGEDDQISPMFSLRDVVGEECLASTDCETSTTTNEIFLATLEQEETGRFQKILVHSDTIIDESGRSFANSAEASNYVTRYGLRRLRPSRYMGWWAKLRFARCSDDELSVGKYTR